MDLVTFVVENLIGIAIAAVIGAGVFQFVMGVRTQRRNVARNEALFVSMFPDLQPYFHPTKLIEFVRARLASRPPQGGKVWKNPPGFGVEDASIGFDNGRESVQLRDAQGQVLADFFFEEHPEGGVIRFGKGKFTVNLREQVPRVRYWHPDREFKWSQPKGWTFVTRVADEPFSRSDSDSSSSSSSGSSRDSSISGTTAAAAGAAGIVAAGGAFDGGGASQAWDDSAGSEGGTATAY